MFWHASCFSAVDVLIMAIALVWAMFEFPQKFSLAGAIYVPVS